MARLTFDIHTYDGSTVDDGNNPVPSFPKVGERKGSLESTGGGENDQGFQVNEVISHMVKMRNDSLTRSLKPRDKLRIQEDRRILQISSTPDYATLGRTQVQFRVFELIDEDEL